MVSGVKPAGRGGWRGDTGGAGGRALSISKKNHTTIHLASTHMKHCINAGVVNYNIIDHKLISVIKKKV